MNKLTMVKDQIIFKIHFITAKPYKARQASTVPVSLLILSLPSHRS